MKIRHATIDDFPEILAMSKAFHQCTQYRDIEFDDASCYLLCKSSIEQGMCFVSESDQVTGFILGMVFPCPFNQMTRMASELAWWVKPEFRNSSAGVKLLKALESSAKDNEAESMTMICLESLHPDTVQGIYERMGYSQVERSFLRKL